jgi:hypothetical protein
LQPTVPLVVITEPAAKRMRGAVAREHEAVVSASPLRMLGGVVRSVDAGEAQDG